MQVRIKRKAEARGWSATVLASMALLAWPGAAWAAGSCPVAAPSDLASAGYLTLGTGNAPPLPGVKPLNLAGFEADFADALAATMCLKTSYVRVAFAGLFPALNARKFDAAIGGIDVTEQRQEAFSFMSYTLAGIRLLVRAGSGLYIQDEKEACGRSVGVPSGTVYVRDVGDFSKTCPAGKPIDMRIYPNSDEMREQLRKGNVELAVIGWAQAQDVVQRLPNDFALGSPVMTGQPPEVPRHTTGLMYRKDDRVIGDALEAAFTVVRKDGTYARLLDKWGLRDGAAQPLE